MIDVCELFAGVGGFRVGLEKSSSEYNFVWSNQYEPSRKSQFAYDCYVNHFGIKNNINIDITKINKNEIPAHDLLVGGFPCQDYSVARTGAKGIEGKKGVLWWQIAEILKAKRPKFVLLENVDRLLKSPANQRGRDFGVMLVCLHKLGYSVEWRVINAADYGFVQRRRRVFIFAFKNDTVYAKNIDKNNLKSMIYKDGFFIKKFPITKDGLSISNNEIISINEKEITDISDNFSLNFKNSGVMVNGIIYTEQVEADYHGKRVLLKDILETNIDEKYYINDEEFKRWEYLKGDKSIPRVSKNGYKYVYREGSVPFPDPIDKPARTMLTKESLINRSSHVIEDPITRRLRTITPIEAERINGFDDNWTNTGMPERFRYFCMGNALVVGLVTEMGEIIKEINELENN